MSTPFRITRPQPREFVTRDAAEAEPAFKGYLDRLMRLIPGDVVGVYLLGAGVVPRDTPFAIAGWAAFCLVLVFCLRVYGTADKRQQLPPQWGVVLLSMLAFIIWLYSIGGPFAAYGLYVPYVGSLLVLAFAVFVPIVYRGNF
jgi:hypothetical protein